MHCGSLFVGTASQRMSSHQQAKPRPRCKRPIVGSILRLEELPCRIEPLGLISFAWRMLGFKARSKDGWPSQGISLVTLRRDSNTAIVVLILISAKSPFPVPSRQTWYLGRLVGCVCVSPTITTVFRSVANLSHPFHACFAQPYMNIIPTVFSRDVIP